MLDDENILNQFHVRDFLREYTNKADAVRGRFDGYAQASKKVSAELRGFSNGQKKPTTYKRLLLVAEDGAGQYQVIKSWLDNIKTSLEMPVILADKLDPKLLNKQTLVLAEETWFDEERERNLLKIAQKCQVPTFSTFASHDDHFGLLLNLVSARVVTLAQLRKLLRTEVEVVTWANQQFGPELPVARNLAKQLALFMVGKTAIFTTTYANQALSDVFVAQTRRLAHNLAFSEELVAQMKGGNLGWVSHPVDKPFATFVIKYNFSETESQLVKKRAQQLSGLMPASREIELIAENRWQAVLKANALATYIAIYLAVLNKQVLPH